MQNSLTNRQGLLKDPSLYIYTGGIFGRENVTHEQLRKEQEKYFNLALKKYSKTLVQYSKTSKVFNEKYFKILYSHSFMKKFMYYFKEKFMYDFISMPNKQKEKQVMIKEIVSNYVINAAEAVERTVEHIAEIKQLLKISEKYSISIKKIKVTNSDPHKKGKQVVILTLKSSKADSFFSKGKESHKIVYKPTNLNVDKLLVGHEQSIAEYLNAVSTKKLYLPTYEILPCSDEYGFMECLSHKKEDYKCPNQKQFEKFSQAFGSLSTLATIFGIDDRHFENVYVQKFFPYFIDLETSFSTRTCGHLENTIIMDLIDGSLMPKTSTVGPPVISDEILRGCKSVLVDKENKVILVSEKKFRNGFMSAMEAIAINGTKIIQMIGKIKNIRTRYVPISTNVFSRVCLDVFNQEESTNSLQEYILAIIKTSLTQLSDELSKPTRDKEEYINRSDLFFVKFLIVCYLNIESMYTDLKRGDIPYFSVDSHSGKVYDSDNKELKWDVEKMGLLLSDIDEINKQKRHLILGLFEQLKSPAQTIIESISKLQTEYQKNNEDITKCSLYAENIYCMQSFFKKTKDCKNPRYKYKEGTEEKSGMTKGFKTLIGLLASFISFSFINDE